MKKLFLLTIAFLGLSFAQVQAQSAIGARLTNGGEISYQTKALGSRIELDLGWNLTNKNGHDGFHVAGLYQIVNNIEGGFNWYYGFGATIGASNDISVGACGDLGIEYNFSAPFQLSLDWRPTLGLIPSTDFYGAEFGLGIRYRF